MNNIMPLREDAVNSLAMALVQSSKAPLLLIDDKVAVIGASASFCNAFNLDPATIANCNLAELGEGEWASPQLQALLRATIAGAPETDAYEMDLVRAGKAPCRLVLSAHKLDYFDTEKVRIVLAATDVTRVRLAEKEKDALVREKQILLQELQHRVANSLQIIASVLMQSAKRVQSEETRQHLHDAHNRVMSIATLQKQLAASDREVVQLQAYFADLCHSISASMIDDPQRLILTSIVDETAVKSEVSVSMGLIVTELVINAIKHAFERRNTGGKIVVTFEAATDGSWLLGVTDNGSGMPSAPSDATPGLGTGIVEALSRQLDAKLELVDAKPGTRVEVRHGA